MARPKKPKNEPEVDPIDDHNVFLTNPEEYEDGTDPIAEGISQAENDPRMERVENTPRPIDPNAYTTPVQQPDGTWHRPAADNVGRPTVVPLWDHAHVYPAVTQLRVWRVVNGNPHEIGAITCKAGMDDFIETFWPSMPKEGEQAALFEARGMDGQGNFMGQVFPIGPIDANHLTLRQMRAARAGVPSAAPVPSSAGGFDLKMLEVIKTMFVDPALEQARLAQEEARAAREARDAEARRIADERIDLAKNTGATVEVMSAKVLDAAAEAERQRTAQQSAHYVAMTNLEKADRERERERIADERKQREEERRIEREEAAEARRIAREEAEEQRKKDREEAEAKRKQDLAELEEKRRIEREEREEARKDREREYQRLRAEEREREDARRKEEQERIDQRKADDDRRWQREREEARLAATEREVARAREHAERLAQLERQARQDQEHQARMMALSKQDSPEGAIGSLNKALAPLGIDIKELALPFIQRVMSPESEFDVAALVEGVGKIAVDGLGKVVDYAKTMKAIEAQKQGMGAGHPVMGQQQIVQQQVAPQQQGGTTPAAAPAGTPVVEPAHNASSLPLDMQRACRAALRTAINEMRQSPEEKWPDVVQKAFNTEPGLYHWFKQLTIRGALKDIQVEAAFIDHILNHPALNNPLLAEVPRG